MKTRKRKPTPAESKAIDLLSRAMVPAEWAEYDTGNGTCTNMAGWKILESIDYAKLLVRRFPGIVPIVNEEDVLTPIADRV